MGDDAKTESKFRISLGFIEKLLLPATLGLLTYYASVGANRIAEGQLALIAQSQERQNSEADSQRQLKLLELVYQDIVSGDRAKQMIALELAQRLEPSLAATLAESVAKNTAMSAPVRARAATIATDVQRFSPLYGFRIAIYYRADSDELASRARSIKVELEREGLPNIVVLNPRNSAFFAATEEPQSNEVRFEPATEGPASDLLLEILNRIAPQSRFRKREVTNRSPNFLSLYLK